MKYLKSIAEFTSDEQSNETIKYVSPHIVVEDDKTLGDIEDPSFDETETEIKPEEEKQQD